MNVDSSYGANERIKIIKEMLSSKSDSDLAKKLKVDRSQITRWRKKGFGKSIERLIDEIIKSKKPYNEIITLNRYGNRPVRFEGTIIAEIYTESMFWTEQDEQKYPGAIHNEYEIRLYKTEFNNYIINLKYKYYYEGDDYNYPYSETEVFRSIEQLIKYLKKFDPISNLKNTINISISDEKSIKINFSKALNCFFRYIEAEYLSMEIQQI